MAMNVCVCVCVRCSAATRCVCGGGSLDNVRPNITDFELNKQGPPAGVRRDLGYSRAPPPMRPPPRRQNTKIDKLPSSSDFALAVVVALACFVNIVNVIEAK